MTEAKGRATPKREPAKKKTEEKTISQMQLDAFMGPNGKNQAVAYFKNNMPRLLMHYDYGTEVGELIAAWGAMGRQAQEGTLDIDSVAGFAPSIKRLIDLSFGENAREIVFAHWDGDLSAFFTEVE